MITSTKTDLQNSWAVSFFFFDQAWAGPWTGPGPGLGQGLGWAYWRPATMGSLLSVANRLKTGKVRGILDVPLFLDVVTFAFVLIFLPHEGVAVQDCLGMGRLLIPGRILSIPGRILLNSAKFCQILLNSAKFCKILPNSPKFCQILPNPVKFC